MLVAVWEPSSCLAGPDDDLGGYGEPGAHGEVVDQVKRGTFGFGSRPQLFSLLALLWRERLECLLAAA